MWENKLLLDGLKTFKAAISPRYYLTSNHKLFVKLATGSHMDSISQINNKFLEIPALLLKIAPNISS